MKLVGTVFYPPLCTLTCMAPVPPRALDHVLMSDEELTIDEQSEGGGEGSGGEAGEEGAETKEDPSQREVKWGLPDGL